MRIRQLIALFLASGTALGAQSPAVATLRGEVYDSLNKRPLDGASVSVTGIGRTTTTDSRGRFHFDSVVPGTYTVVAYHALLDSIGLGAVSARTTVGTTSGQVTVSVPSFDSFWRLACGDRPAPRDSGIVYGTIRDANTGKTVTGAKVDLSWVDVSVDSLRHMREKRWHQTTRTDASGNYGVCGVPISTVPSIEASYAEGSSGSVDLVGDQHRVRRRDLSLGPLAETDSSRRGIIAGLLTDPAGQPFAGAQVLVQSFPETRSGADGRFVVRNVPTGTRQVEIRSVGMAPFITTVDVTSHDTAMIAAQLKKVATLDVVRVTGTMRQQRLVADLEARRKMGLGFVQDSTAFEGRVQLVSVFAAFPHLAIQRVGNGQRYYLTLPIAIGRCAANLWIDGKHMQTVPNPMVGYDLLLDLQPDQIAAIEVYPHGASVPMELQSLNSTCGAVAIWTKWALGR